MDPAGKTRAQPSIRSFFQPRQPKYATPPSLPTAQAAPSQPTVTATTIECPPATAPIPPPAPTPTPPVTLDAAALLASIPILPPPPSLPPQASIVPVLEHHIPALRRINSLLLPVTYPDAFYANILCPGVSGLFSRVILWQDDSESDPKVVGGLVCRLEPSPFVDASGDPQSMSTRRRMTPPSTNTGSADTTTTTTTTPHHAIYIQSLTLLSPYRSHGLATAALENIAGSAALLRRMHSGPDQDQPPSLDVATIYAHVWTENKEGLRWYAARGFTREGAGPVEGYYFKLRPDSAWVVRREIDGPAMVVTATTAAAAAASPVSTLAAAVNLVVTNDNDNNNNNKPARDGQMQMPTPPTATPSPVPSMSYQKTGPGAEWNDLPAEMVGSGPPGRSANAKLSAPGSGASSSRSSSTGRKKKERSYPVAAFGS